MLSHCQLSPAEKSPADRSEPARKVTATPHVRLSDLSGASSLAPEAQVDHSLTTVGDSCGQQANDGPQDSCTHVRGSVLSGASAAGPAP